MNKTINDLLSEKSSQIKKIDESDTKFEELQNNFNELQEKKNSMEDNEIKIELKLEKDMTNMKFADMENLTLLNQLNLTENMNETINTLLNEKSLLIKEMNENNIKLENLQKEFVELQKKQEQTDLMYQNNMTNELMSARRILENSKNTYEIKLNETSDLLEKNKEMHESKKNELIIYVKVSIMVHVLAILILITTIIFFKKIYKIDHFVQKKSTYTLKNVFPKTPTCLANFDNPDSYF